MAESNRETHFTDIKEYLRKQGCWAPVLIDAPRKIRAEREVTNIGNEYIADTVARRLSEAFAGRPADKIPPLDGLADEAFYIAKAATEAHLAHKEVAGAYIRFRLNNISTFDDYVFKAGNGRKINGKEILALAEEEKRKTTQSPELPPGDAIIADLLKRFPFSSPRTFKETDNNPDMKDYIHASIIGARLPIALEKRQQKALENFGEISDEGLPVVSQGSHSLTVSYLAETAFLLGRAADKMNAVSSNKVVEEYLNSIADFTVPFEKKVFAVNDAGHSQLTGQDLLNEASLTLKAVEKFLASSRQQTGNAR